MNTGRNDGKPFSRLSGHKGGYRKLTVMLPPDDYEWLIRESVRRKISGEADYQVSSILRAAITRYFDNLCVKDN
jgi:hypothetical protein